MALQPGISTKALLLELAGASAGSLRSLQPPSWHISRAAPAAGPGKSLWPGATVSLGEMRAEAELSDAAALLAWANGLASRQPVLMQGVVQVLDSNARERRRLVFADADLTLLSLPRLSATDGKRPFTLGLAWQPAQVDDLPGSGKSVKLTVTKRKPPLCGNFRVLGLPFDASFISAVGLPSVSARLAPNDGRRPGAVYAAIDNGELALVFAGRSSSQVLGWVRKQVADGRIEPGELLNLSVELLDASLKQVLASVQLDGCGLLACEEAPLQAGADANLGEALTLRFTVDRLSLKVPA